MGRFNHNEYRPSDDSSANTLPGVEALQTQYPDAVILYLVPTACGCGCGAQAARNSKFRPGHDARYKGTLIRAYLMGCSIVATNGDQHDVYQPMSSATGRNWEGYLTKARHGLCATIRPRIVRGTATDVEHRLWALHTAEGPSIGGTRLVKIGRWEYPATAISFETERGKVTIEYHTRGAKASTKTVEIDLAVWESGRE